MPSSIEHEGANPKSHLNGSKCSAPDQPEGQCPWSGMRSVTLIWSDSDSTRTLSRAVSSPSAGLT